MAESGKDEGRGGSDDRGRDYRRRDDRGRSSRSSPPDAPAGGSTAHGTKGHLPRDIVIQLTGTEGQWGSPDDYELLFSLERDKNCPSISLSKERHTSGEDDGELHSPVLHVPFSPPSPDSLGNFTGTTTMTGSSFLSPGPSSPPQRPLASLVKSLSTELEFKESSTLRPRPLLSLVKSISTELSRSEPEVSQSKSDSRLNLHLWKQLTQPRQARGNGDSRTAPPSPSSLSPSGESPKGGFFKMELEDTKRKFSAVQEPLSSMFNKIMRDESMGSPKHQCRTNQGKDLGREGSLTSLDAGLSESPVGSVKGTDADSPPAFDWPYIRHPRKINHRPCPVHCSGLITSRGEELEICTDDDVMQVVAIETCRQRQRLPVPCTLLPSEPVARRNSLHHPPPLPRMSLFFVAALSYGYFTLPLSPYLSGLAVGLAMGFMLGLLLIRLGSSRSYTRARRPAKALGMAAGSTTSTQPEVLKGWMNEICEYDAESYHPSLTQSVFATLEGSRLRLDSPRSNISRRATYDEKLPEITFVRSRSFQLAHSKVYLLPSVLARKRLWNPKYPICIQLAKGEKPLEEEKERGTEERRDGEELSDELATQREATTKPATDPIPTTLYLFGRTGREKEEWFHCFQFASMGVEVEKERGKELHGRSLSRSGDASVIQSGSPSRLAPQGSHSSSRVASTDDETPLTPTSPSSRTSISISRGLSLLDYPSYMAHLLATELPSPLTSPVASSTQTSPTANGHCTCNLPQRLGEGQTAWANALIGRIFWDFLRERHWSDMVSNKIQKKLSKIRLPYFMNELTLNDLDMGSTLPQITATSRPEVNHKGLWLEVGLVYTGALQMTLQTKFNLSKLGKDGGQDTDSLADTGSLGCRSILNVLADSDEESSSAGSSDEEDVFLSDSQSPMGEKGAPPGAEGAAGGRTGRKILRFMDKITKSKYFQKATENEFIKKKMENMSNMPLLLTVEVRELSGTLTINIPPPPTDRIWYSFCVPPRLDLRVCPKLGEREVTLCHVTEWIEKKLQDEFQKVFVFPNMDDILLPLMHSGIDSPPPSPHLSTHSPPSRNPSMESIEKIPVGPLGQSLDSDPVW